MAAGCVLLHASCGLPLAALLIVNCLLHALGAGCWLIKTPWQTLPCYLCSYSKAGAGLVNRGGATTPSKSAPSKGSKKGDGEGRDGRGVGVGHIKRRRVGIASCKNSGSLLWIRVGQHFRGTKWHLQNGVIALRTALQHCGTNPQRLPRQWEIRQCS